VCSGRGGVYTYVYVCVCDCICVYTHTIPHHTSHYTTLHYITPHISPHTHYTILHTPHYITHHTALHHTTPHIQLKTKRHAPIAPARMDTHTHTHMQSDTAKGVARIRNGTDKCVHVCICECVLGCEDTHACAYGRHIYTINSHTHCTLHTLRCAPYTTLRSPHHTT
jgi:hypothetical protein